jgi:hypothetical protein
VSLRCAPPPVVPGQESRCAALGLDSRRSRRHSTGVLHGEELIHGTQHQQVKVDDHVGIEVPPGAPRCGPQPCRPVPSALVGPAPGGPPTCRELRQRASGYGSATVPPAPGSIGPYGRTSPRPNRRAHSGPR